MKKIPSQRAIAIRVTIFFILILLFQDMTVYSQQESNLWWKERPLRIYHPNMREYEAENLNVEEFIAGCRDLNAEAIVFSTGGVYAFYDTKVAFHVKSPNMGDRDLLKEVVNEAHKYGIKVIARFDFEKARPALFKEHPEWFYLNEENKPTVNRSGNSDQFYKTEILEGYQNEDFAFPVLREVFQKYKVDGVHLNAPGFSGLHFREEQIRKFNIPEDPDAQQRWRAERLSKQMLKYREIILEYKKDALFMAEINSPENPGWGINRGFDHELLSGSYTNLLSTSGEANDLNLYKMRWWVSLTADWSHASNSPLSGLPLVNLKAAFVKGKYALKPVNEYRFQCYQAMAHNAGVKAATYGLINNMPDERTSSMIDEPFRLMKESEKIMTNAEKIVQVALIWPAKEELGFNPSGYSEEMFGLYRTLISEHVLFDVVLAHRLTSNMAKDFQSIIIPSVAVLSSSQSEFLKQYIMDGGNLIVQDAFPDKSLPEEWKAFLGGKWGSDPYNCAYGVSALKTQADFPYMLILNHDIRQVEPPKEAEILYTGSPTPGGSFIPETYLKLKKGDKPLSFTLKKGKGTVSYFGSNLGEIIWMNDFPDYSKILENLLYTVPGIERKISLDAPGTISITAYRKDSNYVLHLVNATGKIPLEEAVPVGPIRITLKNTSSENISFLQPGEKTMDLEGKNLNGNLNITIDKLGAYGMLIIKTN